MSKPPKNVPFVIVSDGGCNGCLLMWIIGDSPYNGNSCNIIKGASKCSQLKNDTCCLTRTEGFALKRGLFSHKIGKYYE